jgi:GTPase SAR1 family protein
MEGNPTKCKIVLLGDQSVGKTSIINRFIFDNFTGHEQVIICYYLVNCWS